jgi:hypothetical protein
MSATAAATDRAGPPPDPPAAPPPSPPDGRSRRWPIVAGALVAGAAIVAALVFLRPRHDRPASPSTPAAHGALGGPSTGPAEQRKLLSALQAASRLTLHATYRALGDPAKLGGPLTAEVWLRPPDAREDRNGAPLARCQGDGKGAWTCPAVKGVPGPLDLLAAVASHAARATVTTSPDVVGNEKVTCYQLAVTDETYMLCATANATPALIANTTVRYELVTASSNVPSSAFAP